MPLLLRDTVATAIAADLSQGRNVLLDGDPGAGKSTVVAAVASRLGSPVRTLDGLDRSQVATFVRFPAELRDESAVLLVDDADRLDPAFAVLVAQTARVGVPVLCTIRAEHRLAPHLVDEVRRTRWARHLLDPLEDDAVLALAEQTLGDGLAAPSAAWLLERADGNPGAVVSLVRAARPMPTEAGVDLGTPPVPRWIGQRLAEAMEGLDGAAHHALELVATAGRLPLTVLDQRPMRALAGRGLVVVEAVGVRPARHLIGDAVVAGLPAARRAELLTEAAALLASLDLDTDNPWSAERVLLRARTGGAIEPAEAVHCARTLLTQHRYAEATVVLGDAGDAGDPELSMLRGAAASGLGDLEEADRLLSAAEERAPAELLAEVGRELGLLHAVRRAEPTEAIRRVGRVADRLGPSLRTALDADLIKWHLMAGATPPQLQGAAEASDAAGRLGVHVIAAMIASLDGTAEEAAHQVAAGLELADQATQPAFAADLLRLSRFLALTFAGDLADAERMATAARSDALRSGHPSLGMWEYAAAELSLHRGRLTWGATLAGRAARHLRWHDFTGLRPSAVALTAALAARAGRATEAARFLASLGSDAADDIKVGLHIVRVEAEALHADGRPREAAAVLDEAARRAFEQAHRHLGILAADEAWMLCPREESAELIERHDNGSALWALLRRRILGWASEDPESLRGCAADLLARGLVGRAGHCYELAATHYERAGMSRESSECRGLASIVLAAHGAQAWPGTVEVDLLTPRELSVARLAAARVRSREIAERLGMSVRTVDNHLGRAFRKLGVNGRPQLASLFERLGEVVPAADAQLAVDRGEMVVDGPH